MPPAAVKHLLCAIGALAVLLGPATAQDAVSLKSIRDGDGQSITIDKGKISVSGISSGGYMANQFHIAHSSKVMGAGILAGGPYHCAASPSAICNWTPYGWAMPHDSCQAIHICTTTAREFSGPYFGPPDGQHSIKSTLAEAGARRIDPVANLKGDRVWLFSGTKDTLVPAEVMDVLDGFYQNLFVRAEVANASADIAYDKDEPVPHAMIVEAPGEQDCTNKKSEPPFLLDCDVDAAGELLTFIYRLDQTGPPDAIAPQHGAWERAALVPFDQRAFFDAADESVSMNDVGHVYVPAACRQVASCPLHVAFHGCRQHREAVEGKCTGSEPCFFFEDAGYNEWAQKHGIVVLYPQTTAWGGQSDGRKNPRGCWDWWGYSGEDYFNKGGKQMQAVDWMIDCLTGARACP